MITINIILTVTIILSAIITTGLLFRKHILAWAHRKSIALKMRTLRKAIIDADNDKQKTGRKNIVVYNSTKQEYEAVQKKLLKVAAYRTRNNGSKSNKRNRIIKHEQFKSIENKSLYATR